MHSKRGQGSCHLQTVRVLLLLFQSGFLLFLFPLWLLWPKLPKLCWIVVVKVGTLVFSWLKRKCFQFSTIEDNVCCGFFIYSFYYVELCSFYSYFLESFYYKWMLNFVKGFLCIYWDNHMILLFQFVNVVYCIDWFADIEKSLHPWDKPTWSWYMIFLTSFWIVIARILLRIFCIYVHRWYWPVVSFFLWNLCRCWY